MFFEEQARIIDFRLRYLPKKELVSVLAHDRKIFNCRCLLNAIFKVSRNCSERTLNIAVIKQFRNSTFEKNTIIVTEVVLISCSLTVDSKQKQKITKNIMASSYLLKISSTQNKGVPFFTCLAHGVQYYISMSY